MLLHTLLLIVIFSTVLISLRFLEVWLLDKEEYYAFPSYINLGRLLFIFLFHLFHIIQKTFIVLEIYTKHALLTIRV